jgi:capsular polysaccharide transport system permease protein
LAHWLDNTAVVRSFRVFAALMLREMITRYGRSLGGYVWAVVEPLAVIAMFSLVFSQFLDSPPYGESFLLFFSTGYLPFFFFLTVAGQVGGGLSVNRELLQLPMVRPLDLLLARFALAFLTLAFVAAIIFGIVSLTVRYTLHFDAGMLLAAFASAAMLGLGVGMVNAFLFALLPVWRQFWSLVSAPLMVVSGVFYALDSMPADVQALLVWNPLVHCVGITRHAFFPSYNADYASLFYVVAIAIAFLLPGLFLITRFRWILAESR